MVFPLKMVDLSIVFCSFTTEKWQNPSKKSTGPKAVVTVSRLLRSVQTLMGICQSDFGEAKRGSKKKDPAGVKS